MNNFQLSMFNFQKIFNISIRKRENRYLKIENWELKIRDLTRKIAIKTSLDGEDLCLVGLI